MKEQPQISIITVVFNGEAFIGPTIESVLNQTYQNKEYLVIEGQSSDGTLKIIRKYAAQIDQIVSEPDSGVYDAMNKGLNLAKGNYVVFINAGDEFSSPDILEKILTIHSDADVLYGETNILNKERIIIGTRSELTSRKLPEKLVKNNFLKGQVVSHQSFIAKRSLCHPYDLKYKCSADIDWMLHIVSQATTIVNVQQPIANYLQGGISDRQLYTCWKERLFILLQYFNLLEVVMAHVKFAMRFLKWGRYK